MEQNTVKLLQGHVVLITGASRGIGAATARLFGRYGAAVAVNYHTNEARAQEVVEAIHNGGGQAIAVQASVSDTEQTAAMIQQVEQQLGPIDTLVMNAVAGLKSAGASDEHKATPFFVPFLESNWEQLQLGVAGILASVYLPARAIAPLMAERGRGNLIAVSSLAARLANPGSSALTTGKAAVDALMRVLAAELGPYGIRVNVVSPGLIETEASAHIPQERREMLQKTLPLRRLGQPEDVAGAILMLAMQEAQFLTGNYLAVGGGNYMPS